MQRKRPGGISYFEFEAGSGGIVLDASEKGLGFQAADAVHQMGPSRIWISPRPEERIELTGDVVWTDQSRKTGGVRFIGAGADSSKKLRTWLAAPEESEVSEMSSPSEGFPLPAWGTQSLIDLRHESRHDANLARSMDVPPAKTGVEERPLQLHSIPGLPSLFTSSQSWEPKEFSTSDGRITYRIATGFLIVVLAVAGVVLLDMFRPKVGETLIHLGEKIKGTTDLRPQNSSPQPSSGQAATQTEPSNETKPDAAQTGAKPVVAQKETRGDFASLVESSKQVNTQSSEVTIPRAAQTTKEALNRLPNREAASSSQERSMEATRLWSAVASGDSSAEVELAGLYLRGEGVARNCEQARVLLRAAAKGGNLEARQQLKKLRSRGCG